MRRPSPVLSVVSLLASASVVLAACSSSGAVVTVDPTTGETVTTEPTPTPEYTPPPELPRGGREIFPTYRLVGFAGVRDDPNEDMGRLTGDLDQRCREIEKIGKNYTYGREIMPVFEFIPVVVHGSPQADGTFRTRVEKSQVRQYLKAARRCEALLLLNIQPGRSEFLPEMKHYLEFLKEPDVGVALDPEWAMNPGEIPGRSLGHSDGPELNKAAEYLAGIVAENDLPEKVMVFHQFNFDAVTNLKGLKPHEGVAIIRSIDGLGGPVMKVEEYNALRKNTPDFVHPGFKLFFKEDTNPPWGSRLMTPEEVMALRPRPEYILYE